MNLMVEKKILVLWVVMMFFPAQARAEFILNSAILEFYADGPKQQDVELISR